MKRPKIVVLVFVKAALSGILVLLVLRKVHVMDVASRIQDVDYLFLIEALACFLAALFVAARRWQVLSAGLLSYGQTLKYTWVGMLYAAILPGLVSGDVAKGASLALKDRSVRVGKLPLSIAMDRAVGLYALLGFFVLSSATLAFGSGFLSPGLKRLGLYGFLAGSAMLLVVACVAGLAGKLLGERELGPNPSGRMRSFLSRALDTFQLYWCHPRLLMQAAGCSVVIHVMDIMAFYLVIRALHVNCRLMEVVVFYSIVSVLISLPITVSGLGVRDWFSLAFFQSLWGDGQAGVAFAWLSLMFTLVMAIVGGIVQIVDLFASRAIQKDSERPPACDNSTTLER
jgi:glycosyltransferase 2 family protein